MFRAAIAGFALAVVVPAQTVHRVGPGGFPEIQPAIAAAAPGDVIEVAVGNYQAFTLDKPLTITALPAPPGNIVQILNLTTSPRVVLLQPPAGTTAYITNIHFRNIFPLGNSALSTRVTSGTVCFEECTLEGPDTNNDAGLAIHSASVVLRHCWASGGYGPYSSGPGVTLAFGSLFAIDCVFGGGPAGLDSVRDGGPGLSAYQATVHLVRVDSFGGWGAFGFAGGSAVALQQCTAWLADCNLTGGSAVIAPGGHGLSVSGTQPAVVDRVNSQGGTGTPPGQAFAGPTVPQVLLGLTGGTVSLVRGQPWTASYRTGPRWPIAVFAATAVVVGNPPTIAERLLLTTTGAQPFALLTADGNGDATLATTVPNTAALQHARVYLQAFSGTGAPVHTQPPLGGVIR